MKHFINACLATSQCARLLTSQKTSRTTVAPWRTINCPQNNERSKVEINFKNMNDKNKSLIACFNRKVADPLRITSLLGRPRVNRPVSEFQFSSKDVKTCPVRLTLLAVLRNGTSEEISFPVLPDFAISSILNAVNFQLVKIMY